MFSTSFLWLFLQAGKIVMLTPHVCLNETIFRHVFVRPPHIQTDLATLQKTICSLNMSFTELQNQLTNNVPGLPIYIQKVKFIYLLIVTQSKSICAECYCCCFKTFKPKILYIFCEVLNKLSNIFEKSSFCKANSSIPALK